MEGFSWKLGLGLSGCLNCLITSMHERACFCNTNYGEINSNHQNISSQLVLTEFCNSLGSKVLYMRRQGKEGNHH